MSAKPTRQAEAPKTTTTSRSEATTSSAVNGETLKKPPVTVELLAAILEELKRLNATMEDIASVVYATPTVTLVDQNKAQDQDDETEEEVEEDGNDATSSLDEEEREVLPLAPIVPVSPAYTGRAYRPPSYAQHVSSSVGPEALVLVPLRQRGGVKR